MSRFCQLGGRVRHFETARTFATIFVEAHTPQIDSIVGASFSGRELVARALSMDDELKWDCESHDKEESKVGAIDRDEIDTSGKRSNAETQKMHKLSGASSSTHKRVNSPEEQDLLAQLRFLEEEQKRVRSMLGRISAKAERDPHGNHRRRISSCVQKLVAQVDAGSFLILCQENHELDRPCKSLEEAAQVSADQERTLSSGVRAPFSLSYKGNYCTLRRIDLQDSSSSEWHALQRSCAFHGKST